MSHKVHEIHRIWIFGISVELKLNVCFILLHVCNLKLQLELEESYVFMHAKV